MYPLQDKIPSNVLSKTKTALFLYLTERIFMKKSLKIGLIALIALTVLNTVAIIFIYSRATDAFDDLYKKTINSQAEIEKIKIQLQK